MSSRSEAAYLIVNADDYGYFRCVSKGILDAAAHGIVTATGVFATAGDLAEQAAWLRDSATVDVGVHLNLTDGEPLTSEMKRALAQWSGRFPGKFAVAAAIVLRKLPTSVVRGEWRAQIDRALESRLGIRFLNSHEHLHALPSLYPVARELASEYGIPHLRMPTSRFEWKAPGGSLVRSLVMNALEPINRRTAQVPTAGFLGMEASGKLDLAAFEHAISALCAGRIYELMCHPGHYDAAEVTDPRLRRYHDWEGELRTLTSAAARELLQRRGVRLIGYRDLEISDNRLVVRDAGAPIH